MAKATTAKKKPTAGKSTAAKKKAPAEKASADEAPAAKAPAPAEAVANAALAGQAALAGTRAAGKAVTLAASRAKGPLAAAGGLVIGVAGGRAVVNRRRGRRRPQGLDIAGAAERVGALGEEVGRVAIVIQQAAGESKRSR
jgi:hypothetical protein